MQSFRVSFDFQGFSLILSDSSSNGRLEISIERVSSKSYICIWLRNDGYLISVSSAAIGFPFDEMIKSAYPTFNWIIQKARTFKLQVERKTMGRGKLYRRTPDIAELCVTGLLIVKKVLCSCEGNPRRTRSERSTLLTLSLTPFAVMRATMVHGCNPHAHHRASLSHR